MATRKKAAVKKRTTRRKAAKPQGPFSQRFFVGEGLQSVHLSADFNPIYASATINVSNGGNAVHVGFGITDETGRLEAIGNLENLVGGLNDMIKALRGVKMRQEEPEFDEVDFDFDI